MKSIAISCIIIIICGMALLAIGISPTRAANYDFQSIQRHPPTSMGGGTPSDTRAVSRQMRASGVQEFTDIVNSGGPVYGAAEAAATGAKFKIFNKQYTSKGLVQHLKRMSISQRVRFVQKLGIDKRHAHKIVKGMGKNMDKFAQNLAVLDNAATYSEMAGAIYEGDEVGAGQALVNGTLSGTSAAIGGAAGSAAGTWAGLKIGASIGAVGGPLGSAIGGGIGTVGGALLGSYLYDWYGKPGVNKAADKISADLQAAEEAAENKRRRIRTDWKVVNPHGTLSASNTPFDPDQLHQQAERIRDQRNPNRVSFRDECPLDPNKTKPGICGCGTPDIDTDGDGLPDCVDKCPRNAELLEPGPYGCGDPQVPRLKGLTAEAAENAISKAGFEPALGVGDAPPDRASEFTVYSQAPAAGTTAAEGTAVSATIYSKYEEKKVKVPDVVGLGATEAKLRVAGKGLVAATARGDKAPEATKSNTVQGQSPAAGEPVEEQSTVTLSVYGPYEKNERCRKNQERYYAAYQADNWDQCRQILSQSQDCAFAKGEGSQFKKRECHSANAAFYGAMKAQDYGGAQGILARHKDCDFYSDHMQYLQCSKNLSALTAAYNANDTNRFKSLLAQSKNCDFYGDFVAALQQSEQQRQRNQQLAQVAGHVLGAALQAALDTRSNSAGSGGGDGPSGPPVVKYGTCNDVRKAGANNPERHVIDLGTKGRKFLFEFETYTEEDMIIVSQGGRTLFNSGCVGTKGRRVVQLKKGMFSSEIVVDVRPNCNNGTSTQWEFMVHCPK